MTWGDVPMDCRVCSQVGPDAEASRRSWGCDEPATIPLLGATCWRCGGYEPTCDLCGGAGEVPVERCPFAELDPDAVRVCEYANLLEIGILPVRGGLEDQSVEFLAALRFVQPLKVELEKQRQEKQNARARSRNG